MFGSFLKTSSMSALGVSALSSPFEVFLGHFSALTKICDIQTWFYLGKN